jgi:hypothetical protein
MQVRVNRRLPIAAVRRWSHVHLMRRDGILRIGVCLTLWMGARDALHAQTVQGVLLGRTPPQPLSGVVITAARTRDGEIVARGVTSESGRFLLTVGSDSVVVRALRIGQRPVTLFLGRLAAGAREDVSRTLPDEPVAIASVRVRERARCGATTPDSSVVSALFADALTALAGSVSAVEGVAPVMRSLRVEEERDRRGRVQAISAPVVSEGATTQAFRSVPVPLLLHEGFVVREADGGSTYRAPDAVVLTDDRFLARTCLALDRSREDDGRIGIRFTPAKRSDARIDVEGVLWLDAATRALETLEFGYLGLTSAAAAVNPGGTVEYTQLPDGRWIIERWALRMPRLDVTMMPVPRGGGRMERLQAVGTSVVRGLVTEVRSGDRVLYSMGGVSGDAVLQRALARRQDITRPVTPEVLGDSSLFVAGVSAATLARVQQCAARPSDSATRGIALVVRVIDSRGQARAATVIDAEWRTRYTRVSDDSWAWQTARARAETNSDGEAVLCDVTVLDRVEVRALPSGCAPVRVNMRPPPGARVSDVIVRLPRACSA